MTDNGLIQWVYFLWRPRSRYVLAWFVALTVASITLFCTWRTFDTPKHADGTPKRPGGNKGHTMIDFGGQWIMGRMLTLGLGEHLYDRKYLWQVVTEAYPRADETPDGDRPPEARGTHEAEDLMSWLVGHDEPSSAEAVASLLTPMAAPDPLAAAALTQALRQDAERRRQLLAAPQLGGPLYPPIHALLMYPLGYLRPALAYRVVQVVILVLAFVVGWAVRLLSHGRIWWPVATAAVILYPGFAHSVNLGQNSALLLALLAWGWTLMVRGRPIWGGILWGVLAYKPVWAAAFFLVPLLTGRWRVCLAMLATGGALAAATLPLVGWQNWLHWLEIGRMATATYHTDENWVFLSRDLLNIPRRWLVDFQLPVAEHHSLAATVLGWTLYLTVILCFVALTCSRKDRRQALSGTPAAFLLLGAWLSCFHFMFYDVLLTALPVILLVAEQLRNLEPRLVAVLPLPAGESPSSLALYQHPRLVAALFGNCGLPGTGLQRVYVLNSLVLSLVALLAIIEFLFPLLNLSIAVSVQGLKHSPIPMPVKYSTAIVGTPWSTFCILAIWAWCGWQWWRMPDKGLE